MNPILQKALPEISAIMKKHNVIKAFAFGSVTGNSFGEGSDLDFIVSFNEGQPAESYSDNYFELLFSLEKMFSRKIDLLTENNLRNPYLRSEIDKSRQLIYG